MVNSFTTTETITYNGENTVSTISHDGKTGQLPVKYIRTVSNTIYKNTFKVD